MTTDYLEIQEHRRDGTALWHDEPLLTESSNKLALELLEELSKTNSRFSFGIQDERTDKWFHTAITLEYDARNFSKLTQALEALPLTFFLIPTISDRDTYLVVFPLKREANTQTAKRIFDILGQWIGPLGLTRGCNEPTHRFRFRANLPIHFVDEDTLDAEKLMEDAFGLLTKTHTFFRKRKPVIAASLQHQRA